jgi:hypothetical protein
VIRHQHAETLQALFSHPLQHNIRISDVEALLHHLNAQVEHLSDHRLKLQLTSGETIVLHAASGLQHAVLDQDGVMRLRRFLERAGITPEHPEPPEPHARGDQAKRLVIHLDHRGARLWWLIGDEMETSTLEPHGLWSTHQRLTNRHDRDVAGQKAPLDYKYLHQLTEAVTEADRVLLLGHGHGQSDMRQLLIEEIQRHYPGAMERIETISLDDTKCSEKELLASARSHFGNQPYRHLTQDPGQGLQEGACASTKLHSDAETRNKQPRS